MNFCIINRCSGNFRAAPKNSAELKRYERKIKMSIPKKGSRKVVVEDISYRWIIRNKPTYSQAAYKGGKMTAAVELYDKSGCTLHITFPWNRPDNWIEPSKAKVTPKTIEECIVLALQRGWEPKVCGSAFEMKYNS
jgi:hypothetical protein